MDDDRSLSALIARLEQLSYRDARKSATHTPQRLARRNVPARLTGRHPPSATAVLVLGGIVVAGAFGGYCYFIDSHKAPRAERPTAHVSGTVGRATP